ncbi:MAG: GH3 auxin-responsive promoter family protein [Deltaproteobacteria bacterium]|nr:GH3 auxin-responsive promoter family protein [Deltaproteobacteria bacterium]
MVFLRWLVRHLPGFLIKILARLLYSKSWARFKEAVRKPREVQRRSLMTIIQRNRFTAFGREHGFNEISSIDEFRARVPIRKWEEIQPYIEQMINGAKNVLVADPVPYYGLSSGTTGTPKYVPMPDSFIDEFEQPRRVWKRAVAMNFPSFLKGEVLLMASPKIEGRTPDGTPYGSIYRRIDEKTPKLVREVDPFPKAIYLLEDFDAKYYCLLRLAVDMKITLITAVNPSTVVLFCKKLEQFGPRIIQDIKQGTLDDDFDIPKELRRRIERMLKPHPGRARQLNRILKKSGRLRPVEIWPHLCGVITWKGGSAPFYLKQFPRWLGDIKTLDYGFMATEGSFNLPISTRGSAGPAAVLGHFLEFVPVEQRSGPSDKTLLADELEEGKDYYLIITASNGLYRYDINDIVRCTGFYEKTPLIEFLHKGGNMLSLTGEKIAESHVVEAVTNACRELDIELAGFAVTQILDVEPPAYRFSVEPASSLDEKRGRDLLTACESNLRAVNIEYAAKRDSQRLGPPTLTVLAKGSFEAYRAGRVSNGAPDAHVKPPHLHKDPDLYKQFEVLSSLRLEA